MKNALLNIGPYKAFKIFFDYFSEKVKKVFVNRDPVSFEEQVASDFGRALAELNMLSEIEEKKIKYLLTNANNNVDKLAESHPDIFLKVYSGEDNVEDNVNVYEVKGSGN